MIDKLDFLVRFWELRARSAAAGAPLTDAERLELLSLRQLVAQPAEVADGSPNSWTGGSLPVQMTARGGFLAGDLREVGADQIVVAAAEPLRLGDYTIVYLADALTGIEYTLPCVVSRCDLDSPCSLRLTVDGIPARARFTVPVGGMLRSPLGRANGSERATA